MCFHSSCGLTLASTNLFGRFLPKSRIRTRSIVSPSQLCKPQNHRHRGPIEFVKLKNLHKIWLTVSRRVISVSTRLLIIYKKIERFLLFFANFVEWFPLKSESSRDSMSKSNNQSPDSLQRRVPPSQLRLRMSLLQPEVCLKALNQYFISCINKFNSL